ncbi:MAG: hypothetical protein LBU66_04690 [Treponema sp.]|jgi:hypothetical protein|nr:hypothetical protein [Treponema sp.]
MKNLIGKIITIKVSIIKVVMMPLLTALLVVLLSCEALPVNYSSSQSWSIPKETPQKIWTSLVILDVQVDRMGSWDSIEREASSLAPFYFWDNGGKVVSAGENPKYAAKIFFREREFSYSWRTKKSLSIEVHIWTYEDVLDSYLQASLSLEQKLPAAVGRITASGEESFSSSRTMSRMLLSAIKKAQKKLAEYERNKNA